MMALPPQVVTRWVPAWYSKNQTDGETRRFMTFDYDQRDFICRTRRECRTLIREQWGYIAKRTDLRREPHGWRLPRAVRVRITVEAV
jgi:hypothetical protein